MGLGCIRRTEAVTCRCDLTVAVWAGEDLNLRRQCRQIYSLLPLAARAPTHMSATHRTGVASVHTRVRCDYAQF
jgi:hypothetical protein